MDNKRPNEEHDEEAKRLKMSPVIQPPEVVQLLASPDDIPPALKETVQEHARHLGTFCS